MFVQSAVREHAELHLLLSMITPLGWLERVPTYKEALENIKDKDLHPYGFLGYPVLQIGGHRDVRRARGRSWLCRWARIRFRTWSCRARLCADSTPTMDLTIDMIGLDQDKSRGTNCIGLISLPKSQRRTLRRIRRGLAPEHPCCELLESGCEILSRG